MIEAHGVGGGGDLPLPASFAIAGGVAALVVSFTVLLVAWRRSRYDGPQAHAGRPAPPTLAALADSAALALTARLVGLALAGFLTVCLVAGPDDPAVNPAFGLVYVVLWVGLVPASLLLGPFVRAISPLRTVHRVLTAITPLSREQGLVPLPARVGLWPAAAGLLAFTWLELVSPDGTTLAAVGLWLAGYVVVVLGGAIVLGERWFAAADPFEAYSTLVAHLSVWSRDDEGRLVVVSPLRHLARLSPQPGLVAAVAVLLGSTAFDSARDSPTWVRFRQSTSLDVLVVETLALVGVSLLVGLLLTGAALAMRPAPGAVGRRAMPARMAHAVVPIVVGYMVAHYLTLLVETGQLTLIQASDPFGTGADLFGTADRRVDIWLSLHPTVLATVKVLAIVGGHLVGAVAAHDRATALLPARRQATDQLPMLAVMVLFTFSGLYLLFGI